MVSWQKSKNDWKPKRGNSWGWMRDDKCISSRWHFHRHLIDHPGDILNGGQCVYEVCVSYAESDRWKEAPTPQHTDESTENLQEKTLEMHTQTQWTGYLRCTNLLNIKICTDQTKYKKSRCVSAQQTQLDAVRSITHSPDVCIILPCMQTDDRERRRSLFLSKTICALSPAHLSDKSPGHVQQQEESETRSRRLSESGPCSLLCSGLSFLPLFCLLVFSSCSLAAQTLLSKSPFRQRTRLSCRERVRDR